MKKVITESELISLIRESIEDIMPITEPLTLERAQKKAEQRMIKLAIMQNRNHSDYMSFWRKQTFEDFPNCNIAKSDDWKAVYNDLLIRYLMGRKPPRKPTAMAKTKKSVMPKFDTDTQYGKVMTMLYADFATTERKGGAVKMRDDIYKELMAFNFKTNPAGAEKNTAGGAWLTAANRAKEQNKYKIEFAQLSDKINHAFREVRSYVMANVSHTNRNDMRDVANNITMRLQTLNEILTDGFTVDRLIAIARMLNKSAAPQEKNFYTGVASGKNIGIIEVLERIKRMDYEVAQTINQLNEFVDTGFEFDIDDRGKIVRSVSESVMRKIKEEFGK